MGLRARRWLGGHPRLVLAVLLAFGVALAPPPAGVVSHRHDGGGVAHTHAGRIAGGEGTIATDRADGDGIRVAAASDLHEHAIHLFLGLAPPEGPLAGPVLRVTAAPGSIVAGETPAASRPSRARAPPAMVA
jgi:hypothetical protein